MSRLQQSGTNTVGLTSIKSGLVPTVIDSLILNASRNETFSRESLYCESLIRGREQYKVLTTFSRSPRSDRFELIARSSLADDYSNSQNGF
jgi:hypothetical protein